MALLTRTIYKKAVFSGSFVELIVYKNGLVLGQKPVRHFSKKGSIKAVRLDNYIRTKSRIKRLAWSNSGSFKTFITLTFADNIQDFNYANKCLDIFQKRFRRLFPSVMYLGVPEFQKRGAIHYHFLCSEYCPSADLSKLWGQGFVKIKRITNNRNLGNYIVKYMTKELFTEKRYFMRKKFFYSKNLRKPIIITNSDLIDKIFNSCYDKIKIIKKLFSVDFWVDFVGKVQYNLFNVQYLL
ncbi:MAG: hypothetical protein PHS54_06235 [Clostridia bacterium]|nr:hypothetical protein [Clostridia bacterium]